MTPAVLFYACIHSPGADELIRKGELMRSISVWFIFLFSVTVPSFADKAEKGFYLDQTIGAAVQPVQAMAGVAIRAVGRTAARMPSPSGMVVAPDQTEAGVVIATMGSAPASEPVCDAAAAAPCTAP